MKKPAFFLAFSLLIPLLLSVGCAPSLAPDGEGTISAVTPITEKKPIDTGDAPIPEDTPVDTPLTEEEKKEALRLEISSRIKNRADSSEWELVSYGEADSTDVYRYKKTQGISADNARLTISTNAITGMSFDVSVESASDGEFQFQLKGGARFVSVTDSKGNRIADEGDPAMPFVILKQGERYSLKLDFSGTDGFAAFLVWKAKAVDLKYTNLSFAHEDGAANTFFRQVIYKSQDSYGYFAWPSVERLDGDRLIAVCSGYRQTHVDPYGKIVGWISEDNGRTWGEPFVIADTVLDDRDAGVSYWNGKIFVTWFTAPNENYSSEEKWADWCAKITPEMEAKHLGPNVVVSEDGGKTWSEPKLIGMFAPHGMIQSPKGELVYVGYNFYFTEIGMMTSSDGVNWSSIKIIANATQMKSYGFHEPHAVYADNGTLIVQMRTKNGIYQCELAPGSDTFTPFRLICNAGDTPPQLIKTSSGALLLTYGCRQAPYGVRARVSYDNGTTWGDEMIVTADGFDHDMGYADTVELADGRLLTVYYQKDTISDRSTGILQVIWEIPKGNTSRNG